VNEHRDQEQGGRGGLGVRGAGDRLLREILVKHCWFDRLQPAQASGHPVERGGCDAPGAGVVRGLLLLLLLLLRGCRRGLRRGGVLSGVLGSYGGEAWWGGICHGCHRLVWAPASCR